MLKALGVIDPEIEFKYSVVYVDVLTIALLAIAFVVPASAFGDSTRIV